MLLAIDVRNTHTVVGLVSGSGDHAKVVHHWRIRTESEVTGDELALTIDGLIGDDADLDVHGSIHVHHMKAEERVTVRDGLLVHPVVNLLHELVAHSEHPPERRDHPDADAVPIGLDDSRRPIDHLH